MPENLRHWSALSRTDPEHTKPFQRAGGFKGTAIKPIWSTKMMTEHFGPCGIGWGMDKPEFSTMAVADEILVYCTTALWYCDPEHCEAKRYVYGVGGDKVAVKRRDGGLIADDEAFKKAYTDALSNAMKQIGVGADVHMGLFDDNKYVNELRQEFAAERGGASNKHAAPKGDVDMRALADVIKDEIDAAGRLAELNTGMARRGEDYTSSEPKPDSDLAKVRAFSETAYRFLIDRANKRRSALANQPQKQVA